ncbi:MAG TPA: arginine--tRNA ligase, partial [Nitrosomonas sp.]|nr:arginine--tRNA ligase [Nitrosomonas sp.]
MTLSAQPNFKTHFAELLHQAASRITPLDAAVRIELARTKQASHGDYSCNLAMQLAKPLHKNPREIAQLLIDAMPASPYLEKIEIAGAGFINLFLKHAAKQQYLHHVLHSQEAFGSNQFGQGKKIQVEFVSANPTGPLHVGHGRGAAIGASLSNILAAAGF